MASKTLQRLMEGASRGQPLDTEMLGDMGVVRFGRCLRPDSIDSVPASCSAARASVPLSRPDAASLRAKSLDKTRRRAESRSVPNKAFVNQRFN
jgi:hypothetical protein